MERPQPSNELSEVLTGTKVVGYKCKDPFKALKYDLSVLCYDAKFYPNQTSNFPNEKEICVDPEPCSLADVKRKFNGEYLTVDIDLTKESIEHGSNMSISCAQDVEKFVAEVDPDGTESLTYKCQTGVIVDSKGGKLLGISWNISMSASLHRHFYQHSI